MSKNDLPAEADANSRPYLYRPYLSVQQKKRINELLRDSYEDRQVKFAEEVTSVLNNDLGIPENISQSNVTALRRIETSTGDQLSDNKYRLLLIYCLHKKLLRYDEIYGHEEAQSQLIYSLITILGLPAPLSWSHQWRVKPSTIEIDGIHWSVVENYIPARNVTQKYRDYEKLQFVNCELHDWENRELRAFGIVAAAEGGLCHFFVDDKTQQQLTQHTANIDMERASRSSVSNTDTYCGVNLDKSHKILSVY